MKKYLFLLILPFLFLTNVNALEILPYQSEYKVSEASCTSNLFNPIFIQNARLVTGSSGVVGYASGTTVNYASILIPVDGSKNYSLRVSGTFVTGYIRKFDSLSNKPRNLQASLSSDTDYLLSDIGSDINYIAIGINTPTDFQDFKIMLNEGDTILDYVDFSTSCGSPTPPTPESNQILTSFLSLYLDRFSYLANGFTQNPYLFVMIGILFSWIVLELFLHILHLKGGYRK